MIFLRRTGHVVSMIVPILALVSVIVASQSQPPAPSRGNQSQQTPAQSATERDRANAPNQQGGNNVSVTVQVPSSENQRDGHNQETSRKDCCTQNNQWPNVVSAFAALAQSGFAFVLVLLTCGLIFVGWRQHQTGETQAKILRATLGTNQEIERAYIAISHKNVQVMRSANTPVGLSVTINVRNYGRTPGDILSGFCGWILQPYSKGPDLGKVTDGTRLWTTAFLLPYPEGFVDFGIAITVPAFMLALINDKTDDALWLVGEVDYRDRFGQIHRGGYGRVYSKNAESLVYDPSTNPLNYDRPLTPAEIKQRAYQS